MRSANGLSLTVVVPVYSERAVLGELVRENFQAIDTTACVGEMVWVDDGSHDGSSDLLDGSRGASPVEGDPPRARLRQQAAVHAASRMRRAISLIMMDADLQDDAAAFRELVRQWERGTT